MKLSVREIHIPQTGIMTATIGHAEEEMAAAMIIRLHQVRGDTDWKPVRMPEFADLLEQDG